MIKFLKKLNTLLCLSAFTAGIIFCLCGFKTAIPKGVTVNGEEVGGLTVQSAVKTVRTKIQSELSQKTLKIIADKRQYSFTYPEISYKDDLREVLRTAKRDGNYTAKVTYYLCGLEEVVAAICSDERIEKVEPFAEFKAFGDPFIYHEGSDGRQVDFTRLKADIQASLKGDFEPVTIKYFNIHRQKTLDTVKAETKLLSSFTTSFDSANINRSSNIRLAAALLNGVILEGGKTLSFNDLVGARLPERGFLPAKIIENGEYTEGVGGGVCQVSTTLYNAALLAGMTVTEYHPHSLAVGYVAPSRDAMVSGTTCDLKFQNPSKFPVYIRSCTQNGTVSFEIYGKSDGATFSIESQITGTISPTQELCTDPALVREGREGITSEGYLIINRAGFIKRVKIRTDKYLPQKRVVLSDFELPTEADPMDNSNLTDN